jgi:hypothetical protein
MVLSGVIVGYSGGSAEDSHFIPFFQAQRKHGNLSPEVGQSLSIDRLLS